MRVRAAHRASDRSATRAAFCLGFDDLSLPDIAAHLVRGAIAKPDDVRALSATPHQVIVR